MTEKKEPLILFNNFRFFNVQIEENTYLPLDFRTEITGFDTNTVYHSNAYIVFFKFFQYFKHKISFNGQCIITGRDPEEIKRRIESKDNNFKSLANRFITSVCFRHMLEVCKIENLEFPLTYDQIIEKLGLPKITHQENYRIPLDQNKELTINELHSKEDLKNIREIIKFIKTFNSTKIEIKKIENHFSFSTSLLEKYLKFIGSRTRFNFH